jgi:histidinol-phosphate aminotransferase
VRDLSDFTKNILPFLKDLEEDEAGPDAAETAKMLGIPEESMVVLSRNENPYGPSPLVQEALRDVPLQRYPNSRPLMKAISGYTHYPQEWLVTGAGMDEVITTICRIFLSCGDSALVPVPTYNFYGVAVQLCGARPMNCRRLFDFSVDPEVPRGVKMAFLCSPNNPTGNALTEENVRAVVEGTDAVVFLDEAYAEFAEKSLLGMVKEYDNLVVGRTLSKAFGLAGLRLGYAVAPPWIAEQYRRVAPLFSVSSLSQAAGEAALHDLYWMKESVRKIVSERERLSRRLDGVLRSQGNFICIKTRQNSKAIAERLQTKGILVRDCSSFPGCGEDCLRVTIGKPEENDRFLEEFLRLI